MIFFIFHLIKQPQLPKKRTTTKPTSAGSCLTKTTTTRIPIIKQLKYDTHDEVADLKVECNNKDMTIREQEKYIDEIKIEIKNLEKKISHLNDKQSNIEQQHKNDIESMVNININIYKYMSYLLLLNWIEFLFQVNLQQGVLKKRQEKYNEELNLLNDKLSEKNQEISNFLLAENELMENNKLLENNINEKDKLLDDNYKMIEELKVKLNNQFQEYKNKIDEKNNELLDAYTEVI